MGEVAGTPVHRGADGAHERGHQRYHHQPQRHGGQQGNGQGWVTQLPVALFRQHNQGSQRDHHPEPAADQIIHHKKHPARQTGLLFVAGGQHPLNEFSPPITAAKAPPLHRHIGQEHRHGNAGTLQPAEAIGIHAPGHQ